VHCDDNQLKKEENLSFSDQPVSLKQKVQHASAPVNYGGLVCLYHSLLSALGVGVGVCISLPRHLKILASACQVNFQTKKNEAPSIFCNSRGSLPVGQSLPPNKVPITHTHTKGLTVDILFVVCLFCVHRFVSAQAWKNLTDRPGDRSEGATTLYLKCKGKQPRK